MMNKLHHEGETSQGMTEEHDWSFDAVRIKYINLDNIKSVLFTELQSSTSQRQTKTTYRMNSGMDSSLIPSKYSNLYFQGQQ